MLRAVVLMTLVALCVAKTPVDHCCSAEDRNIIQEQWGQLWKDSESSKLKVAFGRKVLLKLAELKPEVKGLFKSVHIDEPEGGEFSAHSMRILNAIDMIINLLGDPDTLDEALDHLADQHQVRTGVKREHFKTIGEILGAALPKVLDDYNTMSWKSCFRGILTKIASKLNE
jgi:hemoglobin-like flavoprotein